MPGLLDILTQAMGGAPSGILGNFGAETPNQRVASAFEQLPPGLLGGLGGGQSPQQLPQQPMQLPPGLAQLLLGMMGPQGQQIPPPQRAQAPMFGAILAPGDIDVSRRPVVNNPDGTVSTVESMSINVAGRETLIPTVSDDGRKMSNEEAINTFYRTGRHLGQYATPDDATNYAQRLHEGHSALYGQGNR